MSAEVERPAVRSSAVARSKGLRQTRRLPLLGVATGIVLSVVIPLLLLEGRASDSRSLALAIMAISGLRFGWLIGLGEPRLMEVSVWTFFYVFLGLAPLVQLQRWQFPGTTPWFYTDLLEPALRVFALSALAVLLGVFLAANRGYRGSVNRGHSRVSVPRVRWFSAVSLVLNGYYLYLVGPLSVAGSRERLTAAHADLWAEPGFSVLMVSIFTVPLLIAFLGLLHLRKEHQSTSVDRVLLILTGALALYSVNPISSPRYLAGTVVLAMLAGLGAFSSAFRMRMMGLLFIVGIAIVFPLADAFRREGQIDETFDPSRALTTGDFDGMVQMSNALHVVAEGGITWGRQLLGIPLFWVPRSVWPEKPVGTGAFIAEKMGYSFTNLSSPLPAELFIAGGWTVALLGMFAFGWWVRRRDDAMVTSLVGGMRPSVLSFVLPFYLLILVRGSLQSAAVQLAVILVAYWIIREKAPKIEAGPASRPLVSENSAKP